MHKERNRAPQRIVVRAVCCRATESTRTCLYEVFCFENAQRFAQSFADRYREHVRNNVARLSAPARDRAAGH